MPARSGDCTSVLNRVSTSTLVAGRPRVGAPGREGHIIHVTPRARRRAPRGRPGLVLLDQLFHPDRVALRWPWQRTGSVPPLVSMSTSEKNRFVSMLTDATCAMWIECSFRPNGSGV